MTGGSFCPCGVAGPRRAPTDVAGKCSQERVGIQDAVAISVITHLLPPVVSHAVPESSCVFTPAVVHRSFSWTTAMRHGQLETGWCTPGGYV
jgi:hypothetical protein